MTLSLDPFQKPRSSPAAALPLILGTMNFGRRTEEAEARRIVDAAFDQGIVHFDTANAYVEGESERILGRALAGRRDRAIVTTKVGLLRLGGAPAGLLQSGGHAEGLGRERVVRALEESLSRLQTNYVDFYLLHVPDGATPIEETLEAFAALLKDGKIRAFGVSNYASWQVLEMMNWCDARGVARPAMTQQLYNLLVRQLDVEYFAFARKYGLHTSAYNPLAGGLLTGRHAHATPEPGSRFDGNAMYQRRYLSDPMQERATAYAAFAAEAGLSPVDLAYSFLASHPRVDSVLVGPSRVEHVADAVRGSALRLDEEAMSRLAAMHRAFEGTDATYARIPDGAGPDRAN